MPMPVSCMRVFAPSLMLMPPLMLMPSLMLVPSLMLARRIGAIACTEICRSRYRCRDPSPAAGRPCATNESE